VLPPLRRIATIFSFFHRNASVRLNEQLAAIAAVLQPAAHCELELVPGRRCS
jgi:hypothetical protein